MNAIARKSAAITARSIRAPTQQQQKRGIVDWMTKYPDKVMETKKIQMKGGVCQAEKNPTWWKQSGDAIPLAFGATLVGYGLITTVIGHYRLATGKGKLD